MSILIKGMDLPKDRDTLVLVRVDGSAIVYTDEAYMTTAVPVPTPHGRLIDLDAIPKSAWRGEKEDLIDELILAPTIIEAEGED